MSHVVALKSYISQNKNAILRHCFNPESSVLKGNGLQLFFKNCKMGICRFKFCERNPYISDLSDTSKEAACEVHADDVASNITAKPSRKKKINPQTVSVCSS